MKTAVKNTLLAIAVAIVIAGICVIHSLSERELSQNTCQGLAVEFLDDYNFVTEEDVKKALDTQFGRYLGMALDSINLYRIENILDLQSAVLKSEAYLGKDGNLNISITQREPVVRFQKGETGFYADERGFIFPLQDNFTSLVPIVDGEVPLFNPKDFKGSPKTEKEANWVNAIIEMVNYMNNSNIWNENISQISVSEEGDLILVPREGNERFIFGAPEDFGGKFRKIEKYYQYIRPLKEDGYYSTVNVKYKGQIICRK